MKSKIVLAFAIVFMAGIASVAAQTATPVIKETAREERARIKQGVQSGELTKREARRLAAEQADIHQDVKAAKADGVVTKAERKDIKQEQRQASRRIFKTNTISKSDIDFLRKQNIAFTTKYIALFRFSE